MYFEYDEVTPGPHVKRFSQLLSELGKICEGNDEYAEERKRVLDIFYARQNRQPMASAQMEFILKKIVKLNVSKRIRQKEIKEQQANKNAI